MKRAVIVTLMALGLAVQGGTETKADGEFIDISPAGLPNYVGAGVGGLPDYIGSNDYMIGGAPFGRYTWGERYIDLQVNYLTINVLEDRNWRFGPAGLLRFGRRNVDDPVVDRLPDVDYSVDLGAFVAYQIVDDAEPRDRWLVTADFTHDVTGEHSGFGISAALRKWFPVADFGVFGLGLGTTFGSEDYMDTYFSVTPAGAMASGLTPFNADAGFRDVRLTAAYVQPVSESWVLGAGVMYKRLLGDAADTPITDERGSANQVIFGLGGAYLF